MVSCCTGALQMHGAHGLVMPSFSSDYDGGDFAFSICYSILSRPHLTMACKRKVLERIYGFWKLRIMKMLQFFFPSWIQTTISFLINLHLRSRRLLAVAPVWNASFQKCTNAHRHKSIELSFVEMQRYPKREDVQGSLARKATITTLLYSVFGMLTSQVPSVTWV